MLLNTPLLLLLLLQKLLLFNFWHPIQDVLLLNILETMESMLLSSMMICQNKLLPTDKCLFSWEDLLEEKHILVMSFTCTLGCLKELPSSTTISVEDLWLLCQLSRPKLVMCLLISQQMSSQSLMDRFSWKLNFSIKVSDQLSMWVFLWAELDQLLRSKLWNKLLVS